MKKWIFIIILVPQIVYTQVTFENIKNRQIVSFELTDIIFDLSINGQLESLDRWKEIIPISFKGLNFTKSYVDAGDRLIKLNYTNEAIASYIKAYQYIDKEVDLKIEASYNASFLLYAQHKRSEALFYIDRAIELIAKKNHSLAEDIFYLKRRIVWRYFSRLNALPDNAISAVEFDDDDVWIGMWSGGVGRFSRSESKLDIFTVRNTGLPSNYIRDILVRPDKIWIATHCGLAYYQKDNATWQKVPALKDYKLKTISYDGTYFYVATLFQGVFRSRDGEDWQNIIPRQSVLDVLHSGGRIFIATPERGVFVYQDDELKPFLKNISAKTIIEDIDKDYIWIGTYGAGLIKVNKYTGEILQTFDKKQLGSDYIESLLIMDGQLWIGTLEAGLSIYNFKNRTWLRLGLKEGLPGMDITTLTRENDHLWLGTLAGGIGIYLFR